jgi:hypothetical protein
MIGASVVDKRPDVFSIAGAFILPSFDQVFCAARSVAWTWFKDSASELFSDKKARAITVGEKLVLHLKPKRCSSGPADIPFFPISARGWPGNQPR